MSVLNYSQHTHSGPGVGSDGMMADSVGNRHEEEGDISFVFLFILVQNKTVWLCSGTQAH